MAARADSQRWSSAALGLREVDRAARLADVGRLGRLALLAMMIAAAVGPACLAQTAETRAVPWPSAAIVSDVPRGAVAAESSDESSPISAATATSAQRPPAGPSPAEMFSNNPIMWAIAVAAFALIMFGLTRKRLAKRQLEDQERLDPARLAELAGGRGAAGGSRAGAARAGGSAAGAGRGAERGQEQRPNLSTALAHQQTLQRNMQELMVELEELSREINGQVDTRLRALNLLIQEADQKIKELRRLQGLQEGEGPQARKLPPPRPEPHPQVTSDRYAQVYALAAQGRPVIDIARELKLMTGEVELILALRRSDRRPPAGNAPAGNLPAADGEPQG